MPEIALLASPRTEFGKGAARRVRRAGEVPAVVYGHGQDPRHISLPGHDLMLALKQANVLLELQLGSEKILVLPKAIQRDPVKRVLEHVDLVVVKRGERVTVDIPVEIEGTVSGGLAELLAQKLSVEALATNIPPAIVVDISGVELGGQLRAGELTLPEGSVLMTDPDTLVVHVVEPQAAPEPEAEAVEAVGEAAEAEAPAEEAGGEES